MLLAPTARAVELIGADTHVAGLIGRDVLRSILLSFDVRSTSPRGRRLRGWTRLAQFAETSPDARVIRDLAGPLPCAGQ
jgi:hypothetical protein